MQYELVKVIDRARLLDGEQRRRLYATPDGRPLRRGIHVAFRATPAPSAVYDASVQFCGPFSSWREASTFAEGWMTRHGYDAAESAAPGHSGFAGA